MSSSVSVPLGTTSNDFASPSGSARRRRPRRRSSRRRLGRCEPGAARGAASAPRQREFAGGLQAVAATCAASGWPAMLVTRSPSSKATSVPGVASTQVSSRVSGSGATTASVPAPRGTSEVDDQLGVDQRGASQRRAPDDVADGHLPTGIAFHYGRTDSANASTSGIVTGSAERSCAASAARSPATVSPGSPPSASSARTRWTGSAKR